MPACVYIHLLLHALSASFIIEKLHPLSSTLRPFPLGRHTYIRTYMFLPHTYIRMCVDGLALHCLLYVVFGRNSSNPLEATQVDGMSMIIKSTSELMLGIMMPEVFWKIWHTSYQLERQRTWIVTTSGTWNTVLCYVIRRRLFYNGRNRKR